MRKPAENIVEQMRRSL